MCVIKGGDVELNDKVDHHNIGFGAEIKCKQPIINFTIECKQTRKRHETTLTAGYWHV